MMQVEGTIEHKGFGTGAWAVVTQRGETYELKDAPAELKQNGLNVKITGQIREDVMTIAMIGPVLEVSQYEICDK